MAVWIVVGCVITYLLETYNISGFGVLFNAAYMGGFAMALYVPLTLYINHKYLPKSARPGVLCTVMTGAVSLVYVGFALYCIYFEIAARLGAAAAK